MVDRLWYEVTVVDIATFRTVFPEFNSTAVTDPQITYWLGVGTGTLSAARLAPNTDQAIYLFTAHNLVLGLADQGLVQDGAAPGNPFAPVSSQGAGGLSVGFDNGLTMDSDAGIYNATGYGQRLWKIMSAASKGGFFGKRPINYLPAYGPFAARNW